MLITPAQRDHFLPIFLLFPLVLIFLCFISLVPILSAASDCEPSTSLTPLGSGIHCPWVLIAMATPTLLSLLAHELSVELSST